MIFTRRKYSCAVSPVVEQTIRITGFYCIYDENIFHSQKVNPLTWGPLTSNNCSRKFYWYLSTFLSSQFYFHLQLILPTEINFFSIQRNIWLIQSNYLLFIWLIKFSIDSVKEFVLCKKRWFEYDLVWSNKYFS